MENGADKKEITAKKLAAEKTDQPPRQETNPEENWIRQNDDWI